MLWELAIPILTLGSSLFLLMFNHTSSAHQGASVNTNTAGGWWGAFKRMLPVTNPVVYAIGAAIDKVLHVGRAWVSHWALANVKPIARWFDGLNELNKRTYSQMSGLSEDTAHSLTTMRHVVIPHAAAVAAHPALVKANHATTKAETALARERALRSTVTTQHRAQVRLNVHYSHAIDVALPQQLGRIRTREDAQAKRIAEQGGRIGSLEHGAEKTWEWIRTHPLSFATGAFAGAVAIALQRLGWGVLRCRSWQNLGRSLKCSDANILADLLAAATLAVGLVSLVELAKEEQKVIGVVAGAVRDVLEV